MNKINTHIVPPNLQYFIKDMRDMNTFFPFYSLHRTSLPTFSEIKYWALPFRFPSDDLFLCLFFAVKTLFIWRLIEKYDMII